MAMDPNAVTLAFTNLAPTSAPSRHRRPPTARRSPIALGTGDGGSTDAVTPMVDGAWPAGATIVVTRGRDHATTCSVRRLGAAATVTFMTAP